MEANFCIVKSSRFKKQDSKIKSYLLCLGNILKRFTAVNTNKTGVHVLCVIFLLIMLALVIIIIDIQICQENIYIYIYIYIYKE